MRCLVFIFGFIVLALPIRAEVWINPIFAPAGSHYDDTPPSTSASRVISAQNVAPIITPVAQNSIAKPKTNAEPILTGIEWSGRANFGASLQTGNTDQNSLLVDGEIKAKFSDSQRMRLRADYNRQENNDEITEDNRSFDAVYDHFFHPKWFYNTSLGLEQDDIADLNLRATIGGGLGYEPYKSEAFNLQMVLGPTYLHEDFESRDTDSSIAARWALDYDQKVLEDRFQLYHNHEIFLPADDASAFLFESKTGARVPITKGIVATTEIDFDWDNDPVTGIVEDDTIYAVKIGYEW